MSHISSVNVSHSSCRFHYQEVLFYRQNESEKISAILLQVNSSRGAYHASHKSYACHLNPYRRSSLGKFEVLLSIIKEGHNNL
jgi:hypothetical protein